MRDEISMFSPVAVWQRGARLALGVLGLTLAALGQPAVTVTRLLPACRVVPSLSFTAELVVEVAGPAPAALIVEEEPPPGWVVTTATWTQGGREEPLSTVAVGTRSKWLFDPLGIPVGSGLIRMTLSMPPPGVGAHALQGAAKWIEAEVEAGSTVDSQRDLSVATLHPGWNTLALPFPVQDRAALDRLLCSASGRPLLVGPVYAWDTAAGNYSAQSYGSLEAGQGFLGCIVTGRPMYLLVAATPAADLNLVPGWNLTGVRQTVPLRDLRALDPTVGQVWRWDAMLQAYRVLTPDALLLPGCAYWIYLVGTAPVVVPLAPPR
jgi:hypothetical protein